MAHTHSLGRNVLSELVYSSMCERILNMDLAPGARLGLDRLAEEYRTSPTPVREALNRLAAEKLGRSLSCGVSSSCDTQK